MNAQENSDESIVPAKSVNNGGAEPSAEPIEERDSAKRNDVPADLLRTQNRDNCKSSGLHGVRENVRSASKSTTSGQSLSRPTQGKSRMR